MYHADLGRTILMGLAVGLPAAALAGPGLAGAYFGDGKAAVQAAEAG